MTSFMRDWREAALTVMRGGKAELGDGSTACRSVEGSALCFYSNCAPEPPPGFVPHTFKRWDASQFRGKNATKLHSEEASQQTPSCYRTTPVAGLLLLVVAAYLLSSCYSFNSFAELQKRAHLSLLLMYWNCSLTANYLPYLKKWLILRCEETYTGPLLQWPQLNICLNCKFPSEVFIEFNRFWSEVQIKYCPCPGCKSWEHCRWKVP